MAKIICVTTGLTGILNASFELVAQLQSAGHDLKYASPRRVGERVELQGIPFVQLPEIDLTYEGEAEQFVMLAGGTTYEFTLLEFEGRATDVVYYTVSE